MSTEDLFNEFFNTLPDNPAAEAKATTSLGAHKPAPFALPPLNSAAPPPAHRHAPPPPPAARAASSGGESDGGGSGQIGAAGGWSAKEVKKEAVTPPLAKPKRTRNRKPSSCVQCRKKKLRCNRAAPCDQCTARGDHCAWDDAVPLFDARAEHDADELRAQVRRLETLVAHLTSQKDDDGGSSSDPSVAVESMPSPRFEQFPSTSRPDTASRARSDSQRQHKMDLRANDLCEALSQLAIKEFVVVEGSGEESWAPGGGRGTPFIDEAAAFISSLPQQFGLTYALPSFTGGFGGAAGPGAFATGVAAPASEGATSPTGLSEYSNGELSPSPLGSAAFHRSAPPLSEALRFLPTDAQAMSSYTYYSGYVSWYAHCVHLPTFEEQWAQLKEALKLDDEQRAKRIDPFFVATFLGICAMGLAMMPVKRAQRDGFGGPAEKVRLVDKWLEGAMVALTCGRFLDNPSVESVRAVSVLSTYFVFMSHGESSGAGMGLLSLVVQVAMSLTLHRDPDRTPGRFTFFEAEMRRRLFYSLFTLCILSSSSLGRTWAIFDLNQVDCKLPLDCHDHEILKEETAMAGVASRRRKFEETPMTSLLLKAKLAVMAKKVNDRAFGIHPVSYATVLELDKELREFEDSIPARYRMQLDGVGAIVRHTPHVTVTEMRACMIQISLCSEFIRIHRPWLGEWIGDQPFTFLPWMNTDPLTVHGSVILAGSNELWQLSRDRCLHYAKLTLAIFRSPSCNQHPWGGLSYKATSAAVVLAVDILTFPHGSEVDSTRALIKAAAVQMEAHAKEASLSRKGAGVIRFLLAKEAAMSAQRDQQRDQQRGGKRARTTDIPTPASRTLRPVFASTPENTPYAGENHSSTGSYSSNEDELRRRVPPSFPAYPSYPSAAPRQQQPQHQPHYVPPQYRNQDPRPAHSLPRQSVPGPAPPPPSSHPQEDYRVDFGAPSALGDFAFDFAVPSTSYDPQGGLQYHITGSSNHLPTPPSYLPSHPHALDPHQSSYPSDVKPSVYASYPPASQPPPHPYY